MFLGWVWLLGAISAVKATSVQHLEGKSSIMSPRINDQGESDFSLWKQKTLSNKPGEKKAQEYVK